MMRTLFATRALAPLLLLGGAGAYLASPSPRGRLDGPAFAAGPALVHPACAGVSVEASAPTRWRACGRGCSELEGGPQRLFDVVGGGGLYGITRRGERSVELEIARAGGEDPRAVYFARSAPGSEGCAMTLRSLSAGEIVLDTSALVPPTYGEGQPPTRRLALISTDGEGRALWRDRAERPLEIVSAGARLALTTDRRSVSIDDGAPREIWRAPGRLAYGLRAAGSGFVFTAFGRGEGELMAWGEAQGLRMLVRPDEGAAAGLSYTDGRDLVWLEGRGGLDPGGASATAQLLTAPLGDDGLGAPPRRLRDVESGDLLHLPAVVGGRHFVSLEGEALVVTRLADGASVRLPPRPGRSWGAPIGVDAEALIAVEYARRERGEPALGRPGTLVRRTIASLPAAWEAP
jgi:hypothetical protein